MGPSAIVIAIYHMAVPGAIPADGSAITQGRNQRPKCDEHEETDFSKG